MLPRKRLFVLQHVGPLVGRILNLMLSLIIGWCRLRGLKLIGLRAGSCLRLKVLLVLAGGFK